MKLNLGSHNKVVKGFLNVDVLKLEGVDIQHDLTKFPYPFETESIDGILMEEFLEHVGFADTIPILKECHRILKRGAKMHVQVPDCGSMMYAYMHNGICENVPHKPTHKEEVVNHSCPVCDGDGFVNPKRWLFAFTGAQKHEFDFHRNIFTDEILRADLLAAGFQDIQKKEDEYRWKLKFNVFK